MKTKPSGISLSTGELDALLSALPLVSNALAATDLQDEINRALVLSVTNKIRSNIRSFSADELRVMYLSALFAIDVTTTSGNEFISSATVDRIDPTWRRELSENQFLYNVLASKLEKSLKLLGISL